MPEEKGAPTAPPPAPDGTAAAMAGPNQINGAPSGLQLQNELTSLFGDQLVAGLVKSLSKVRTCTQYTPHCSAHRNAPLPTCCSPHPLSTCCLLPRLTLPVTPVTTPSVHRGYGSGLVLTHPTSSLIPAGRRLNSACKRMWRA